MVSPRTNDNTMNSTVNPNNILKTDSTPDREPKKMARNYLDETVKNDISFVSNKQFYHEVLVFLENIIFNDDGKGILLS